MPELHPHRPTAQFEVDIDLLARVITPRGELDDVTVALLFAAASALAAERPGDLLLDLHHVTGVGQSFVAALRVLNERQPRGHSAVGVLGGRRLSAADLALLADPTP